MSRPLVSIVIGTYQRAHLLERSLQCYETQRGIYPQDDLELVVIDDHSTDHTQSLVMGWAKRTGIKSMVIVPHPKPNGEWRDSGAILNYGIRASTGHHILLTHPEVMPGQRSVAACVGHLEEFERSRSGDRSDLGPYACCRIYYLSPRDQERIDTVGWYSKGALAVREIEGFYDEDGTGNPDYTHRATDIVAQPGSRLPQWHSWVFGGHSRETWKKLGGMLETNKWGSVDVAWCDRRRALGIPTYTAPDEDCICVHQNHDLPGNVMTPRNMDVWMRELKDYDLRTPSKLVYPSVDFLGWGG